MPTTTPNDRKAKATDLPDFTYTMPNGHEVRMPPFRRAMTAGFLRKHRNETETELLFLIIESLLEPDDLAEFDDLNLDELEQFFDAWRASSGVGLGES